MGQFAKLVPKPEPGSINRKYKSCPTAYLIRKYGLPGALTTDCSEATSAFWKGRFVTKQVHDKFRVTGHRLAVDLLKKTLDAVKVRNRALYDAIGTAGMLCIRKVRGASVLSNHGLGLAVDFTLEGQLDTRGDNEVEAGLIELYKVFKEFGWYWGAGFPTEDGMHFEVSEQVVMQWINQGIF